MYRLWTAWLLFAVWISTSGDAFAQPTYKLEVKPTLKPLTVLKLEGDKISRSALKDDPGFRLQYTFKKEGKPLTSIEARANTSVDIPDKSGGTYAVVVELFHPSYKTGTAQKGQFKPVSNELVYQIKPPAQAGAPVQITVLAAGSANPAAMRPLGKPGLIVQCGKGMGAKEKEVVADGYGYKLIKGTVFDGWIPPAAKSHCWLDNQQVQFELTVPKGTEGQLRLHLVDGDGTNMRFRTQNLAVEGRATAMHAVFHSAGVMEYVDISAEDTKDGKLEVLIKTTHAQLGAVVSTVEFFPAEKK